MSILPICITGEPVLHRAAAPIESFDSELRDLVADMIETMHAAPGVGLAAPQVASDPRSSCGGIRAPDPSISYYRDVLQLDEGPCARLQHGAQRRRRQPHARPRVGRRRSGRNPARETRHDARVRGLPIGARLRLPLRRALGAVLRGYDVDGNAIEVSARGWLARIFQHEYDHLQGTLYVDRLEAPYADEAQRVIAERGWGSCGYTWTPGERA